jgi:hypothetical protein
MKFTEKRLVPAANTNCYRSILYVQWFRVWNVGIFVHKANKTSVTQCDVGWHSTSLHVLRFNFDVNKCVCSSALSNVINLYICITHIEGYEPYVMFSVGVLCNKPEGRGFYPRWGQRIFHCSHSCSRTMALGSTHRLAEMRHCATNRKVAVRYPMRWIILFNLPNPSGRTRPWGLLSL